MSKFNSGNIKIDDNNNVIFIDKYNNEHRLKWNDVDETFTFSRSDLDQWGQLKKSTIKADKYKNATNARVENVDPHGDIDSFILPTIWINTSSGNAYILKKNSTGRFWDIITTGSTGVRDERLSINDGNIEPPPIGDYQMWVIVGNNP